ncbi:F-box/kelch-repeat protein At3g06240-like [Papaver somniferum]|uniref:F-box/kelch-repeat protein At3g06240-like n=1 Tax=Papaver somniferum TaxID=3469 RepID=UPI000E6F4E03|nr:F-box/kelch-repeat protein At3g06240-like [Papaver somniferum]
MHLDINTQRKNYNIIFEGYDLRTHCRTLNSISYDSLWSVNGGETEIVELADYPIAEMCPIAATKEYKIIKSESIPGLLYTNVNAFGYDGKADDYKLIFLSGYAELIVYMLGSNTWKRSRCVPYVFPSEQQTETLVNGSFHWLGQTLKKNSKLIVVFDFCNEEFDELQLPKELLEKKHLTIGVLGGCLCVTVTVSEVCFEVWVMQDYGVQESWTPRYTFDYHKEFMGVYDALKLMSSFRNDHILVRTGQCLFIYDPKHPRGRNPKSLSSFWLRNTVGYVESLVSLNSGTYAGRNNRIGV